MFAAMSLGPLGVLGIPILKDTKQYLAFPIKTVFGIVSSTITNLYLKNTFFIFQIIFVQSCMENHGTDVISIWKILAYSS